MDNQEIKELKLKRILREIHRTYEYDGDTGKFINDVRKSKRPIIILGDIEAGKTSFLKWLAEILLLTQNEKIIGLTDSADEELFEFAEKYKTVWFLPTQLHDCYESIHPNLEIKYIDLRKYHEIFYTIEESPAKIFIADMFFPIIVKSFLRKSFRHLHQNFPEACFLAIELSTAINARQWQTSANIMAGALIRQIRHIGKNGCHFLGDAQSLGDIDIAFRRTGGFKYVYKRLTQEYTEAYQKAVKFSSRTFMLKSLPNDQFIAKVDGKTYLGYNLLPSFSIEKEKYSTENYFISTDRYSPEEIDDREDHARGKIEQLAKKTKIAIKEIHAPSRREVDAFLKS